MGPIADIGERRGNPAAASPEVVKKRVSGGRYATCDFLAVVFLAPLFGTLGVAETLPGLCKTEANTSCWAARQCTSALPSLRPSATHK